MSKVELIYDDDCPKGIRDESGYLIFFPVIPSFYGQEERWIREMNAQSELAQYLLTCLQNWQKAE